MAVPSKILLWGVSPIQLELFHCPAEDYLEGFLQHNYIEHFSVVHKFILDALILLKIKHAKEMKMLNNMNKMK